MCIRDSRYTSVGRRCPEAQIAERDTAVCIDHVGGIYLTLAVSYTHLRAHETVLDLVCRLLLEKKNTSSTYVQRLAIARTMKHTSRLESLTTEKDG